jgi:formylglycine-generating enzyme required for sulfatase activity
MRTPIKPLLISVFSLMCLFPVSATDLATYEDVYKKNDEAIRQVFQPKFSDLQKQYQASLNTLKTLAQNQGDLKKTKAALAEINRFQKERCLPAAPDDSLIAEIKAFQAAYINQYSKLEIDLISKLGTLTAKYACALDRLLKELTKAGRFDAATAVEAELAKVKIALKGYSDQMSLLTGAAAMNASPQATRSAKSAPATDKASAKKDLYWVVDLSGGKDAKTYPLTTLADVPKGGWGDEYKTNKLVLRRLEPKTFVMGSPTDEKGRKSDETQHTVTLTQSFYIGVFEVTQKQWELVMGNRPSYFNNEAYQETHPVEMVSYDDIRGAVDGAGWPSTNNVDAASFLGVLRVKTGRAFDLPTESQWECACRSLTATALNSGKNLSGGASCQNLSAVGRYKANAGQDVQNDDTSGGTVKVGSYLPNAWGLYDMHGNVREWCLDWYGNYPGRETDPKGAATDAYRVIRGGGGSCDANGCRSASRGSSAPTYRTATLGFRLAVPSDQP